MLDRFLRHFGGTPQDVAADGCCQQHAYHRARDEATPADPQLEREQLMELLLQLLDSGDPATLAMLRLLLQGVRGATLREQALSWALDMREPGTWGDDLLLMVGSAAAAASLAPSHSVIVRLVPDQSARPLTTCLHHPPPPQLLVIMHQLPALVVEPSTDTDGAVGLAAHSVLPPGWQLRASDNGPILVLARVASSGELLGRLNAAGQMNSPQRRPASVQHAFAASQAEGVGYLKAGAG